MNNETYEKLEKEHEKLIAEIDKMMDDSAKEGIPWEDFIIKAKDIYEKIYFISRKMRLTKAPTLEYNKEWKGDTFTIEEFKNLCNNNTFTDEDGIGYYATYNAKSDVEAMPSDFIDNEYRTDFTHIIWFNK